MDTNKMREQFEAWECDAPQGPQTDPMWLIYDAESNAYGLDKIQDRWEVWQASREAVVVELPNRAAEVYREEFEDVEGGSFNEAAYIRDVRKAIEAQGLGVSP
ncbi:hypothetical protein [Pseudomonas sp. zfem002]|uniref:hypothetical protein n=1 Tax=Pseudomonas sp. zfem002 TaxID=3078197 RepID=UPI0029282BEC|nr:hypothetical protein [Pseudomonas sp. zfem002]MDU9393730.1 hypothetical protein [Pseudomonas sp. zfem002]